MATNTATVIIITAGGITFANEWYQTKKINWKIPLATILAGALFDGLSHLDDRAATTLATIVLIGALMTKFNGKSIADTIDDAFSRTTSNTQKPKHPLTQVD
jgi:hypothetical protein